MKHHWKRSMTALVLTAAMALTLPVLAGAQELKTDEEAGGTEAVSSSALKQG